MEINLDLNWIWLRGGGYFHTIPLEEILLNNLPKVKGCVYWKSSANMIPFTTWLVTITPCFSLHSKPPARLTPQGKWYRRYYHLAFLSPVVSQLLQTRVMPYLNAMNDGTAWSYFSSILTVRTMKLGVCCLRYDVMLVFQRIYWHPHLISPFEWTYNFMAIYEVTNLDDLA